MSIRTRRYAAGGVFIILSAAFVGCASRQPPPELVSAQRAYQEAQQSPASTLAPAELLTARQALQRAEIAYDNEPDSQRTKDLAYVAERRAQWVKAVGSIAASQQQVEQARRDYMNAQAEALARIQQQHAMDQQSLARAEGQVQAEREARQEAERRSREAVQSLGKIATIREDPQRGTVVTLSGSVLFASGQSALLPSARERLDQVAVALKQVPTDLSILVEGYTDSRGSQTLNEDLSRRRADSVRDYLVARGVTADRIRAVGRGPASPVADNTTAEGRANNRRVEIVIETAAAGQGGRPHGTMSPGSTGQGMKSGTGQGMPGQGGMSGTTGQPRGATGSATNQGAGRTGRGQGTGHGTHSGAGSSSGQGGTTGKPR